MVALIQALAVAEYLSFSRAAKSLGVSQSSVSARIKALEEDLGILLFERNTRGVRLTEAVLDRVQAVGAVWRDLDLTGASLVGVDLRQADLRGSSLWSLDPAAAQLSGAIVTPEQALVIAAALGLDVRVDD